MSLFLKLNAEIKGLHASYAYGGEEHKDTERQERWINIDEIVDIHQGDERTESVDGVDQTIPVTVMWVIKNAPTIIPVGSRKETEVHQYHFLADGNALDIADRINALRRWGACCEMDEDESSDEPTYPTKWRGTWAPGRKYEQLDIVAHPDDVSEIYVALAGVDNKSTAKLILKNKKFWCKLKTESD